LNFVAEGVSFRHPLSRPITAASGNRLIVVRAVRCLHPKSEPTVLPQEDNAGLEWRGLDQL